MNSRARTFLLSGALVGGGAVGGGLVVAACSDDASSAPSTSTPADGDSGVAPAALTYRGQGCGYDVTPPERNGFVDLALDDAASAGSEPVRVRIGLGGETKHGAPGYADPSRTAVMTWETPESVHAARVRFGTSPDALDETRSGFSWITPPPTIGFGSNEPETSMHEVHLCGLEPGTTYYYQVGGGSPEIWGSTQSFTTVPASGKITVGILGDARDDVGVWQRVQLRMRDLAVNMQVTTGDLVFTGTMQSLYDKWLGAIWRDPTDASRFVTLGQQMMVMVAGNHENEAARFYGAFALPGNGPYAETYASFDVGNAHFVVLDDQSLAVDPEGDQARAELDWLSADLAQADANRAQVPFVVVVHHRGVFTTSAHAEDSDVLEARKLLVPVYDAHHVDLVVNGHDHAYERSKVLRAGPDPAGPPAIVGPGQGTVYLVNAGAGAPAYGVGDAPYIEKSATFGKGTAYDGLYGVATLEGRTLKLESYGLTASGADTLLDTLELTK